MKTLLMTLALLPTAAAAYSVVTPHPGTVKTTTYSANGAFHGAVDIAPSNGCGYWGVLAAVRASLSWNVTIRSQYRGCYADGIHAPNEAKHTFASGYTFRHIHFLYSSTDSRDRTCDRCSVGDAGSPSGHPTHLQLDRSGTLVTSWYAGTAPGDYLSGGDTLGTFN